MTRRILLACVLTGMTVLSLPVRGDPATRTVPHSRPPTEFLLQDVLVVVSQQGGGEHPWRVEIHGNGIARSRSAERGDDWKQTGEVSVPREEIVALVGLLYRSDFFWRPDHYRGTRDVSLTANGVIRVDDRMLQEVPTKSISVRIALYSKTVSWQLPAADSVPKEIRAIEAAIRRLAGESP